MPRPCLVLLLPALALVAGCLGAGDEGRREDAGACEVLVAPPHGNVTYAFDLPWDRFQRQAPRLSADFEEKVDGGVPFSIGGACLWFEDEVRWLLALYEEDAEARPSEVEDGYVVHAYHLPYGGVLHELTVAPARYGLYGAGA